MKYLAILKYSIQNEISYKTNYWGSMIAIIIKIIATYFLWTAVFSTNSKMGKYNLTQMLDYAFISLILSQLNQFSSGRIFSLMIARGEIAVELIRPYNLISKLLFYDLGKKIVDLFKYAFPSLYVCLFFMGLLTSFELQNLPFFIFSASLGMITIQVIDILMAYLAFFSTNTWGLWILRNSVVSLFSGAILPLDLFPTLFIKITNFLPFRASIYDPINILFSSSRSFIFNILFKQILWLFFLIPLVYTIYNLAVKKVQVLGG